MSITPAKRILMVFEAVVVVKLKMSLSFLHNVTQPIFYRKIVDAPSAMIASRL